MLDFARNFCVEKLVKALEENASVKRIGKVRSLSIDADKQFIYLNFAFVAEPSPVNFSAKYEILSGDGSSELRLFSAHSEKPWMDEVLKIVEESKGELLRIPLKGVASAVVRMLF